jgi:hypothetical protein
VPVTPPHNDTPATIGVPMIQLPQRTRATKAIDAIQTALKLSDMGVKHLRIDTSR